MNKIRIKLIWVLSLSVTSGFLISNPSLATANICGTLYSASTGACTIPAGVTQYAVEIAGGSGGSGSNMAGTGNSTTGIGGTGTILVANVTKSTQAQEFFVGIGDVGRDGALFSSGVVIPGGDALMGSAGGSSWGGNPNFGARGGSGGGASDLRFTSTDPGSRFIVAGGGGGGGADGHKRGGRGGNGASNGHAGSDATNQFTANSVIRGTGQNGMLCSLDLMNTEGGSGGGGGGGTADAGGGGGGAGCANSSAQGIGGSPGTAGGNSFTGPYVWYGGNYGLAGVGGASGQGTYDVAGGGGGGGYFGGGAGGAGAAGVGGYGAGGGGGGGSSYTATNVTGIFEANTNTDEGYVRISTITSELPKSNFEVNDAYEYLLQVMGFEKTKAGIALPVTYTLENAPKGISINSSTGAITGTIQETGTFSMTAIATAVWSTPDREIVSKQVIPVNISPKKSLSSLTFPSTMKKKSSKTYTVSQLRTNNGQEIVLSASGACKTSTVYKKVKTKVGKKTKYVKTLYGYKLTMGNKAKKICTVTQYAKSTSDYEELDATSVIRLR